MWTRNGEMPDQLDEIVVEREFHIKEVESAVRFYSELCRKYGKKVVVTIRVHQEEPICSSSPVPLEELSNVCS